MSTNIPSDQNNPFSAPMQSTPHSPQQSPGQQGDATGGIIPYKNPHALVAYYLGIISLLPFIGIPFGIASIVLGIIGLKKRKANPIIKGSAHAWVGICCGIFSILFPIGLTVMLLTLN